ncbi:MAG: AAA family ATPase [Chloroflexi bacterium]|nr:AAA family ATPase [Chloroflexota bacterium]
MATPPTADLGGRSAFPAIVLPADALVLLIGVAASGKSTFARAHFAPTEVLSSDQLRALVTDDPGAQGATDDAFDLLHRILAMRLRRGRLTVVDATNVEDWARAQLVAIARRHRRPPVAIILDLPLAAALERNAARPSPRPPPSAVRRQHRWLTDSLHSLADEGFAAVHHLRSVAEIDAARIERTG